MGVLGQRQRMLATASPKAPYMPVHWTWRQRRGEYEQTRSVLEMCHLHAWKTPKRDSTPPRVTRIALSVSKSSQSFTISCLIGHKSVHLSSSSNGKNRVISVSRLQTMIKKQSMRVRRVLGSAEISTDQLDVASYELASTRFFDTHRSPPDFLPKS